MIAQSPSRVVVLLDREDERRRGRPRVEDGAGVVVLGALVAVPAVVRRRRQVRRRRGSRPPRTVLADVADVEVAVRAVEREAPRVAQAVAGDLPGLELRARTRAGACRGSSFGFWPLSSGSPPPPPSPIAGVELAVGAEGELPAVVIVVGLVVDVSRTVSFGALLLPPPPPAAALPPPPPSLPFDSRSSASRTARRSPSSSCSRSRRRACGPFRSSARRRSRAGPARRRSAPCSGCRGTASGR